MGRVLLALEGKVDYSVIAMTGGLKDNAIPRETKGSLLVNPQDTEKLESVIKRVGEDIAKEFVAMDPDIIVILEDRGVGEAMTLTEMCRRKVVALINLLPNGIQSMSGDIPGLVETSLNLGVLILDDKELTLRYAVRSSVRTAKEYVTDKLRFLTEELGGSLAIEGDYPAWEYKKDSQLREDMIRVYREMYGKEPVIQAIHAGLECGLLAGKITDLDAVSLGPDMVGVHTTEEKLSISSTKRVWEYIVEVIKQK
jgi:dipeptidase D